MGGRGSGRIGLRPTLEGTCAFRLSVSSVVTAAISAGGRKRFSLKWCDLDGKEFWVFFSVVIEASVPGASWVELTHLGRPPHSGKHSYFVPLVSTQQPTGGTRWWFECPATGVRAIYLFLPLGGRRFLSRSFWRLGYASQRVGELDRIHLQGNKTFVALGGSGNWQGPLPSKPKWMRWRTFDRKVARLEASKERIGAAWSNRSRR